MRDRLPPGLRRPAGIVGALLVAGLIATWLLSLAVDYDVVADVDVSRASLPPSWDHPLGTDHLGRDVFWRLVRASESFVGPGLWASLLALALGVTGGAASGWRGGFTSSVIRYGYTVIASLPRFVIVLLTGAIYGNDVWVLAAAAAVAYSPALGEAIHQRIEAFRRAEFVLAAQAHGVHGMRVLAYHLLWVNCRRLVITHALRVLAFFLMVETTLSYIGGFGVAEPTPSWGNMIAFEWGIHDGNPWATWAPVLAIWASTLGAVLLAEAFAERSRGG